MAETAAGASGGGGAPALQREGLNDRVIIQMVRMGFSNQNDQIATAILDNKCDKVTAYGNFDVVLDNFSRIYHSFAVSPLPSDVLYLASMSIAYADWCLQSDVMTYSCLQDLPPADQEARPAVAPDCEAQNHDGAPELGLGLGPQETDAAAQ